LTTAAGGYLAAVIENVGTIETALIETEATLMRRELMEEL
jgi:hypothetical protein